MVKPKILKKKAKIKVIKKSVQRLNKTVSLAQNSPALQKLFVAYPDPCDESDYCTACPGHTATHISYRRKLNISILYLSVLKIINLHLIISPS